MPASTHRPRIVFLNRSYHPDLEATGQLLTELCEDLSDRFEVTVICGQPNHTSDNGSYRRWGREIRNGVTIRRVWNTRFPKARLVGRAVNLLSYLLMATAAALAARRPDIVIVESDPPFLCLLGSLLKRWFRCRLIVYLQDIHPDIGIALGKLPGNRATKLLRKTFFRAYRRADRVVVLSEDMRNVLVRGGIDSARITTIPNWVDTSRIRPIDHNDNEFRRQHQLDGKFVVAYSGNLGLCQRLDSVLEAADQLRERKDILFLLIGDGASRRPLEKIAAERGLENVRFLGYQPKHRLSQSLSAADIHLLPVDPPAAHFLMPSKLYGILAAGRPVLAITPRDCEVTRIVEGEDIGFVVPPAVPPVIADRIKWCADHRDQLVPMNRVARQLAEQDYDRHIVTDRFAAVLSEWTQTSGRVESRESRVESGETRARKQESKS